MSEAAVVGPDDLDQVAPYWDAAVDRGESVDSFCSSSIWSFSAAQSFPDADPPVVVTDGASFVGMRSMPAADNARLLVGLDPVWGFASPLVGHPLIAAQLLAARLELDDFDLALVTGQQEDSVQTAMIVRTFDRRLRVLRGPTEQRLRADLSDGFGGWWSRRSSRFRQRMRQLERNAEDAGVHFVDVSAAQPDIVMDRVLAIESASWKAAVDTGLQSPVMADFYRRITWRLAPGDRLRVLLARRDDHDVGFVLGGIRDTTYRGLQLSYAAEVADLGVGHLLQLEQLRRLDGTGIDIYDLGMDMEYKRRWADRTDETIGLILTR